MARVLRLTLLAPDMVEVILKGRQPAEITLAVLVRRFSAGVEGATSEVPQLRPIIRSTGDASITKSQALSAASPGIPLDAREPAWCPSPSQVVKPPRFNAYYDIEDVKPIDGATWKLELAGLIRDKRTWTAQQIYELPEQELIIRHICVEGWDYIGQWSGPNLRAFLTRIGADLTAKYVYFICNDDFTESIDMASALHPQTVLATKYVGALLRIPFGYPLRLRTAVKIGYKNAKWIRAIEVTNTFRPTFWSKQGENWFAGI